MPDLKIYTDEHIATAVVLGLRQRGVDAVSTPEAGNLSASDEEQLVYARANERVILTQDYDFLISVSTDQDHPGIAFAQPGLDIGGMVRAVSLLAKIFSPEEMIGQIEFLK